MEIDRMRERNQKRAEADAAAGPARDDPQAAPLGDAIRGFYERDDLAFGIPAHRAGTAAVPPLAASWAGEDAFRSDLGMTNGVDNRHQSWQVEPTAMQLFAQAVGADQTLFSTNGSSQNVRIAIMTAVHPGETLVMARNGHKSAFAGLVLSGAWPVYVDPVYDAELKLAHSVDDQELKRVLDEHPEARAVLVFSPSYYGISGPMAALADVAHAHDIPLLSDDAWGLDYAFCSRLPEGAMASGADLAIGSVHKTLSGLGQTSVLSVQGDRIDTDRLEMVVELEQSTSASSLLVSSIDAARLQFQRDGERLLGDAIDRAERLREQVRGIAGLGLMEFSQGPGAFDFDPTHVTIDVSELGITGFSAADWLVEHQGVHLELADHRRVMALITYADGDANIDRLVRALRALVENRDLIDRAPALDVPHPAELRTETVMLPRDAYLGQTHMVPWREAADHISAEMICPYPPGIPIIAPGERLTTEIVDYLEQVVAAGAMVEGASDESLAEFRVVS